MNSSQFRLPRRGDPPGTDRPRTRSGFTLTELIVTFALMGTAIAISLPLLVSVARQRAAIEQRQFAVQHAMNLLERQTARPWKDVVTGPQPLADVPADLRTLLPDLEQTVTVTDQPNQPRARKFTVVVQWRGQAGVMSQPVQFSTWVASQEAQ